MRKIPTMTSSLPVLLVLLFLSTSGFADNISPSNDDIQNWWKRHSKEEMKIEGKPLEIRLRNKEVGYIVRVAFYGRGRNFIWHSVLVRPALKEVREIDYPVGDNCIVHDLDNDGISELETVGSGSGQGTTRGTKAIVQFDNWKPIVLHKMDFEEANGNCRNYKSKNPIDLCFFKKEVLWQFSDLNFDGKKDLVEVIIVSDDDNPENKLQIEKTLNLYLFEKNSFNKMKDSTEEK